MRGASDFCSDINQLTIDEFLNFIHYKMTDSVQLAKKFVEFISNSSETKGKSKSVKWQGADQELGLPADQEGEREPLLGDDRAQGIAVRLDNHGKRLRELEDAQEQGLDRLDLVRSAAGGFFLVAALIIAAVLAIGSSDFWVKCLGTGLVLSLVLIIGPPAAVLLWKAALRM
jgi:hypothetical protein